MAAAGLREVNDIDLIAADVLWATLAERHGTVKLEDGAKKVVIGNIEIFNTWYPNVGDIASLIAEADLVEDVPFVKLEKVLEWKQKYGRPEDRSDVDRIQRFLSRSHDPEGML